jgi:ABC-2 type transport system ATP-binding protein
MTTDGGTVPPTADTPTADTPAAIPSPAFPADRPDAVACHGLSYTFGELRAVDDIDLVVRPGEVFGLLGPNGAGKTTTIRVITTLLPVAPGMARVFGRDVARDRMAVRRLLGYVPQQLSADASLTGRENVALFARLFDLNRSRRRQVVAESLESVGLTEAADRMAGTYSGGMIRRLELAQALVSSPRLLILDEPTIGLDPIARTGVWQRIEEIRHATGMTVLVTTHYMDEADRYCDRLALMHQGRIRALGTPAELKAGLRRATPAASDAGDASRPQGTETSTPASLDDVFRHVAGAALDESTSGEFRDVRSTRRTASRLG